MKVLAEQLCRIQAFQGERRLPESEGQGAVPKAAQDALDGTLAEVYRAHFYFVWRNARRLGVSEANLDDVVQEVFIVVHRRLADFDGRVQIRAWIFGILVRVVQRSRRTFQRKLAPCVPLPLDGLISPDPAPSELAERSERMAILEMLLGQLDKDKAMLILLSELEQWTLREIAELMGSNINTVYSRLAAAKRDFNKAYTRWLTETGEPRE